MISVSPKLHYLPALAPKRYLLWYPPPSTINPEALNVDGPITHFLGANGFLIFMASQPTHPPSEIRLY